MNGSEFVERYDIAGEITEGPNSATSAEGWEHYAMTVRLSFHCPDGLREVDTPWKMGVASDVGEFTGTGDQLPIKSVGWVVESLAIELGFGQMAYDEYANDLGAWDEDGYRSWEASKAQARSLTDWCYSQAMVEDLENVTES